MRAMVVAVIVLAAGCAGTGPEDGAGPADAVDAPDDASSSETRSTGAMPDQVRLSGCDVVAGLFAAPEAVVSGFLPDGYELAPHPVLPATGALAVVATTCASGLGAINVTEHRDLFGFVLVEPPPEHRGDADLHLFLIGAFTATEEAAAMYASWDMVGMEAAPVSVEVSEAAAAHRGDVQAGPSSFLVFMDVAAAEPQGAAAQVHRVHLGDATVTGYLDVAIPELQLWQGAAKLASSDFPSASPESLFFEQGGIGVVWDTTDIVYTYSPAAA